MSRDARYREVSEAFGAALARLASGYEADPDKRRDLLQDIHAALWRSLESFEGRSSLRTWVYRVAHNVGATHLARHGGTRYVELQDAPADVDLEASVSRGLLLERLYALIHALPAVDRQLMLLYLEGLDALAIGEVVGLTPTNVATRIHRLKAALAMRAREGGRR
ncbi:MAG: sigma-70 family RNA polymerase sigma factor [Myxococcota bacterium]